MSDGVHFLDLPPWEVLNFTRNCTLWGDWVGVVLTPDPGDPNSLIGPATWSSLALFISALPGDDPLQFLGNLSLSEAFQEISKWYSYNMYYQWEGSDDFQDGGWNPNENFTTKVLSEPAKRCPAEFCQAAAYVGNPDLTGIGVFLSYILEAVLSSCYLFAFTVWHIKRHFKSKKSGSQHDAPIGYVGEKAKPTGLRARLSKLSLTQRTLDAFRGSLDSFLSSAMLISLAMLCASLYLDVQGMNAPKPSFNVAFPFHSSAAYDMILSFLASCFSVFPVMLLYALKGSRSSAANNNNNNHNSNKDGSGGEDKPDGVHRLWMRRSVMLILWILGTVEVYLSPRGNPDYDDRNIPDTQANRDPCNKRGGKDYWDAMVAVEVVVIVVPLLWIIVTTFLVTGFGIPGVVNNRWIRKWRSVWRLGVAWVNLVIMWAVFFYFASLRLAIVRSAGISDAQNSWTFGQVLALVAWVPVVAEFFYIFIWGIEDGLDSHMPSGFEVQRVNSGLLPYHDDADGGFGPDPYEMQQGPEVTDRKGVASSTVVAEPFMQMPEPYRGGHESTSEGHLADPEGQPALQTYYPPYYDHSAGQNPQEPRQHFESTGW